MDGILFFVLFETNNVRSRATYADPAEEPQWRASDFMVCTRHEMLLWHFKLFCIFGLNCCLAGRSDACGVCVCGEPQVFCISGLNCLLAGQSDALRAMTFTGTKLSWILLLLRGVR